jgi:mannan endo-1,4-beta-mannosidase
MIVGLPRRPFRPFTLAAGLCSLNLPNVVPGIFNLVHSAIASSCLRWLGLGLFGLRVKFHYLLPAPLRPQSDHLLRHWRRSGNNHLCGVRKSKRRAAWFDHWMGSFDILEAGAVLPPLFAASERRNATLRGLFCPLLGVLLCCNVSVRADEFVRTSGTQFMLEGKPFFVAGINNHYLTSGSDQEVARVLDDAVAMGATVVRTYLQPVIGSPDSAVSTIWDFNSQADSSNLGVHGNYLLYWDRSENQMAFNDGSKGLQKLDFVLAQAAQRHLKLIIAFMDFHGYTGGAQQVRAWYGGDGEHTFFFADPRTQADYRNWVRHVVQRVNVLTNIAYRVDPTIFAWELMNEPEAQPETVRNRWVSTMAAYVKSLDREHLLSSGQDRLDTADFSMTAIDFVTWHGYPLYYRLTPALFNDLIITNCARAERYQKPILLEEFGYARDNSNPTQALAYQMWLSTIRYDPNCAGWVVWRLVSRQDTGHYPSDTYDKFDIHNDGGDSWQVLSKAAHLGR